jgi:hypothetical protein
METKAKDRTRQDTERPQVGPSHSGEREGEGELQMDETQLLVEELKRDGGVIETHADGRGIVTIWLKRPGMGRQPAIGHGPSFPAALSGLLHVVNRERL